MSAEAKKVNMADAVQMVCGFMVMPVAISLLDSRTKDWAQEIATGTFGEAHKILTRVKIGVRDDGRDWEQAECMHLVRHGEHGNAGDWVILFNWDSENGAEVRGVYVAVKV